jgi:nucleotide-binding universal stress UspA family protein
MVVVDPGAAAQAAIEEGVALARVDGAELVFFHALPQRPWPWMVERPGAARAKVAWGRGALTHGPDLLDAAAAIADQAGVMHRGATTHGPAGAAAIARAAVRHRCGLVVVASEGRNALVRLMSGSVIPGLISLSTTPVMVCQGGDDAHLGRVPATTGHLKGDYRHVMIVVECREGAWSAVSQGLELAQRHGATATLALTVPPFMEVIGTMPGLAVVRNDAAASEAACYGAQLLDQARDEARRRGVCARTVAIDALDGAGDVARCAREQGADVIVVACEPANAVVRLFNGSLVPGLVTVSPVPLWTCRDQVRKALRQRRRVRMGQGSGAGRAGGSPTLLPS